MRLYTYMRTILLSVCLIVLIDGASRGAAAATLSVCASGCAFADLQLALDAAQPGDTILLRAGETYIGHFVLPAKPSGSEAPILIRSDAPDGSLPAAGTRLIPFGYEGGNTDRAVLARLRGRGGQWRTTPILITAPGAHHYRLQFLDMDGVAQEGWETLIELGTNAPQQATLEAAPHSIVLDRVFIHGHPTKGQKRCLALNGRNLEVLNSFIVDCVSYEFDAQAIAGFNGPGPIKIVNNHLEASGENVMFGGADPFIWGLVPSDIEIRRNHFIKPVAWRNAILPSPDTPTATAAGGGSLSGGTYYFKVAAVMASGPGLVISAPSGETAVSTGDGGAVLLAWNGVPGAERYRVYVGQSPGAQNRFIETADGSTSATYSGAGETWESPPVEGTKWSVKNLLELKNAQRVLVDGNVFEQMWPAAQTGYAILLTPRNEGGTAPWSLVRDVTISNNIIRHASNGINLLGEDDVRGTDHTGRITIRNNLVYDISGTWGGTSHFLLVTGSPFDIKVDHNTIFHEGMVVLADSGATSGFEFTNNVMPHNTYGIFGSGAGTGNSALERYFPGAFVSRNAFGGGPASAYPPDNLFPDMPAFLSQFVSVAAHDYRLVPGSTFRGAGTDGRDLGVDFAALAAVAGVVAGTPSGSGGGDPGGGGTGGGSPGGGSGGTGATPYPAGPVQLPGTIEAENFDDGLEGIAYHDHTSGNTGGAYRTTGVDIASADDTGGGFTLGWVGAGEWLQYTVNVAAAGAYDVEFRVASDGAGGTFHLEANGVDVTGPLSVPPSGGWQSWTTVRRGGIQLPGGQQSLRLVMETNGPGGAVGNFNWIRIASPSGSGGSGGTGSSSAPFGGSAVLLPGTLELENFDSGGEGAAYHDQSPGNAGGEYRSGDVDIALAADVAGGYTIGWAGAGEWLQYTVNVASAGLYDIDIRVASFGPGGTFYIEVNGTNRTGSIPIPDTGGWQSWTTVRVPAVALAAGPQTWRLVLETNGQSGAVGNFNYIQVASAGGAEPGTPARDIVFYSSDVTTIAGNWTRMPSSTGAGGQVMQSADWGLPLIDAPSATPDDYFEVQFVPEPNVAYRIWLRLKAGNESKYSDSVWVQLTGAVDAGGAPRWGIGSGSALLVNLEGCFECGVSGWGWQNRAWWLGDDPVVRFTSASIQTLRVQTREDGVEIDQIVLSPVRYFGTPPGGLLQDSTVVQKE